MKHITVKPKSLGGFVRSLSGLFITKDNPLGLTDTECSIVAALLYTMSTNKQDTIDRAVKIELANRSNHNVQVVTNYINKLKKKGVVLSNNRLHPYLYANKILIEWNG